jgi:hypothetical protein
VGAGVDLAEWDRFYISHSLCALPVVESKNIVSILLAESARQRIKMRPLGVNGRVGIIWMMMVVRSGLTCRLRLCFLR